MKNRPDPRPETLAAQAGHFLDPATGAIVPPLVASTTFARNDDYSLRAATSYSRYGTANWQQVEGLIAKLEGAAAAAVLASGLAAAAAVVMTLRPGQRIVVHDTLYWGFLAWLKDFSRQWNLDLALVDMTDLAALERALAKPTEILWFESPTNPLWQVLDIAAIAKLGKAAGARVCLDSTVATPVLTRPLSLGCDLVMHSATKYLNGHSDVLAGALAVAKADEWWERILFNRTSVGASLGPFEAWLLLRGLRTLYPRVRQASQTALALATHLARHPKVERVLYPGLPSHPGHDIARRQMQGGFGGMLSILVKGGGEAALRVCTATELFHRATSLGSVESLIEHRHTVEGVHGVSPPSLLRLSVGLEHPDDLLADLEQALAKA
jgi:cystathionine gamma-synthase